MKKFVPHIGGSCATSLAGKKPGIVVARPWGQPARVGHHLSLTGALAKRQRDRSLLDLVNRLQFARTRISTAPPHVAVEDIERTGSSKKKTRSDVRFAPQGGGERYRTPQEYASGPPSGPGRHPGRAKFARAFFVGVTTVGSSLFFSAGSSPAPCLKKDYPAMDGSWRGHVSPILPPPPPPADPRSLRRERWARTEGDCLSYGNRF